MANSVTATSHTHHSRLDSTPESFHEQLLKRKKNLKNISFGTTKNRELFPIKCADDRLGNQMTPIRGPPHRAPGMYEYDKMTSSHYLMNNETMKPCSKYGKYLNRTEKQFFKWPVMVTPDPGAYATSESNSFESSYEPFNTKTKRFTQKKVDTMETPGPGAYNQHQLWLNRKVTFPQEFGKPDRKNIIAVHPKVVKQVYRTEFLNRQEAVKLQNKLAYFRLYYGD